MHTTLVDLVRDPSLIPHVYDYCDHWCRYCRAAPRCLYYRTSALRPTSDACREPDDVMADGLAWARAVADAAGTEVSRLDVALADPASEPPPGVIGDRLERLGRQYMLLANVVLQSVGGEHVLTQESEATPINVVWWLHMTIAYKMFRALVSLHRGTHGEPELMEDATASAKLVLTSIDRSRIALEELQALHAGDDRLASLGDYLGMLSVAVEKRFPEARTFVRAGLDEGPGA
jgi:hypothetical protein